MSMLSLYQECRIVLRNTKDATLLRKLHLVVPQICPSSKLTLLIFRLVRIAAGGADPLQSHQDLQECAKILAGFGGELAFALVGSIKKRAGNAADLHGLFEAVS